MMMTLLVQLSVQQDGRDAAPVRAGHVTTHQLQYMT